MIALATSPLTIRSRIRAANPCIDLVKGEEYDGGPDATAERLRATRLEQKKVAAWEMAPENHGPMMRQYCESLDAHFRLDPTMLDRIGINEAMMDWDCNITVREVLYKELGKPVVLPKPGTSAITMASDLTVLIHGSPSLKHLMQDDYKGFYDLVCKACMESPMRERFLSIREEAVARMARELAATEQHATAGHKTSPLHEQRIKNLQKALFIDVLTGKADCDQKLYDSITRSVCDERMSWFENRVNDLRGKMIQNAARIEYGYKKAWESSDHDFNRAMGRLHHELGGRKLTSNPFAPPLPDAQAKELFERSITEHASAFDRAGYQGLVRRLIQITLNDDKLDIAISNQPHCDHMGYRSLDRPRRGVTMAASSPRTLMLPTPSPIHGEAEEMAHHAFRIMYKNKSKPFVAEGRDERQELLQQTIMEDAHRNSATQFRRDFGLKPYPLNKIYAEVPAKVVAMMATGKWDRIKDRYPTTDQYITHVICKDVDTFERTGRLDPYGKHSVRLAGGKGAESSLNTP